MDAATIRREIAELLLKGDLNVLYRPQIGPKAKLSVTATALEDSRSEIAPKSARVP